MRASNMPRSLARFTLVELLVVVAIIMLLLALLLPGLMKAKDYAYRAVCAGNQRQQGMAAAMYANDYNQWLPVSNDEPTGSDPRGWKNKLVPYLNINPNQHWYNIVCKRVFLCPKFKRPEGGSQNWDGGYGWNHQYMGYNTVDSWATPRQKLDKVPRPSEVILAGDTTDWISSSGKAWQVAYLYAEGWSSAPSPAVGSRHSKGVDLLWADFHVSWMRQAELMAGKDGAVDWHYRRIK